MLSKYLINEYIAVVQIISDFFSTSTILHFQDHSIYAPIFFSHSLFLFFYHKNFVMIEVRITPVGQLPISQQLFSAQLLYSVISLLFIFFISGLLRKAKIQDCFTISFHLLLTLFFFFSLTLNIIEVDNHQNQNVICSSSDPSFSLNQ